MSSHSRSHPFSSSHLSFPFLSNSSLIAPSFSPFRFLSFSMPWLLSNPRATRLRYLGCEWRGCARGLIPVSWMKERRESIQRQFHRQWWCVIRSFFFSFLSLSHLLLYLLLVFVSLSPLFPLPVLFLFSLFSLCLSSSLSILSPLLMFDGTIVLPDNFVLNLILLIVVVSRLVITLISSPFSFFFSISFSFSPFLFLFAPFLIPSSFWFPLFHLLVLSFVRPLSSSLQFSFFVRFDYSSLLTSHVCDIQLIFRSFPASL